MHPFKHQAHKSGKSKIGSIHKGGSVKNLDTKGYGHVDSSHSDVMEIKDHPHALARGGRAKHHSGKHKSSIARGLPPATPSPDDMAAMQAGAGMPSPSPAPASPMGAPPPGGGMPGMPMQKRGGGIKRASGGRIPDAGQATGVARLQQAGKKSK